MIGSRRMRSILKNVLVVGVLATGLAYPVRDLLAGSGQSRSPHEKVYTAEDFRKGTVDRGSGQDPLTWLVEISPGFPLYRFHFVPDQSAAATAAGNSEKTRQVGRIEISRRGSAGLIQTIEIESHVPAAEAIKGFDARDINFDGYLDIAIPFESGSKWMSFTYWCFDKSKGRFVTGTLTDELREIRANSIEADPQVQEIHAWHVGNECPGLHEIFKIVDGHLVLVKEEKYAPDGSGCILSIGKRIEGKIVVVETRAVPALQKEPH